MRRRDVGHIGWQPWIGILRAVDASVDPLIRKPVHVGIDRPLRVAGERIGLRGQSRARDGPQQLLEICFLGPHDRQVLDLPGRYIRMHIGSVRLPARSMAASN